jgi:hypothetical protein
MSITWRGNFDFGALDKVVDHLSEWLGEGIDIVKDEAVRLCPKETNELANSAYSDVVEDYSGLTGIVGFRKPWASKEHEHLDYHHHNGGQPKYEETAIRTKGPDVYEHIADKSREFLDG